MKKLIITFLAGIFGFSLGYAAMPDEVNRVILKYEGTTYVNDPNDAGGPTKYGWTLKTYRIAVDPNATIDTMRNLTQQQALDAYEKHFWHQYGTCYIQDDQLAATVLLAQINLGHKRPNILLQQMTNAFCNSHLKVDGLLGHDTIHAVNRCKQTQIAFPYITMYSLVNNFKSMQYYGNGLRSRYLHYTWDDKSK